MLNDKDEQIRLRAAQLLNSTEVEKPPEIDSGGIDMTNEKILHGEDASSNQKTENEDKILTHDDIPTEKEIEERGQSHLIDVHDNQLTKQINETNGIDFLDINAHNEKEESENSHDKEELPGEKTQENNKNLKHEHYEHETNQETYITKESKTDDIHEKFIDIENVEVIDTDIETKSDGNSPYKGEHKGNSTDIIKLKGQKIKDNKDLNASVEDIEKQEKIEDRIDEVGYETKSRTEELNTEKDENFDKDKQESKTVGLDIGGDDENGEVEDSNKNLPDNPKEGITEMKDAKTSHTITGESDDGLQTNKSFTVTPSSSSASAVTAISTTTNATTGSTSTISLSATSKLTTSTPSTSLRSLNYEQSSSPFSMVSKSRFSSTRLSVSKLMKAETEIPTTKSTTRTSLMGLLSTTLSSFSRKKDSSENRIMSIPEKNGCSIERYGIQYLR